MAYFMFFFFKQKTAYEMRISDWSSDVCSSDLPGAFLKAYQVACLHPTKSVVLIIEELRRGVAAHIFGDILQLLDRAEECPIEGSSDYEIEARPAIRSCLLFNEIWNAEVAPGNLRLKI